MTDNIHVIKVGGSILSLSEEEIFSFKEAKTLKQTFDGIDNKQYILCVGGGFLCRKYQKLMKENNIIDKEQHNIGVASINMNAVMLKSVFGEEAEEEILKYKDYDENYSIVFKKKFMITAAGSPGHSSDWNTVKLALRSNSKIIISLKNIDGVYTKDPKKYPEAKHLESISWDEYINIIGNPSVFEPGGNYPVDIYAAKLAKEKGIKFYIISGSDFDNMKKSINGEKFKGTIIS